MAYLLDLFTPATWKAFLESGAEVTGFRPRQRRLAQERVKQGDVFLCYLTRLSRWCGALRADSDMYEEAHPVFADPDPFTIRFRVKPIVILEPEFAIPIRDDEVWKTLSMTKGYNRDSSSWTGFFRSSLGKFDNIDGNYLLALLEEQSNRKVLKPLTERDKRHLDVPRVRTVAGSVEVEIPDDNSDDALAADGVPDASRKESLRMQAKVAQIGGEMGFRIWAPPNDTRRVQELVPSSMHDIFLKVLPLNYDEITLRTIEQIDVLWLKGRSIVRAFEIEHTTAIYSGILRMADLLALQPNMDIHLHIVAPEERRSRVLREIKRPVFSLLERGPLYEQCTYLSYESINKLKETPNLSHIRDTIINEYEEAAEL